MFHATQPAEPMVSHAGKTNRSYFAPCCATPNHMTTAYDAVPQAYVIGLNTFNKVKAQTSYCDGFVSPERVVSVLSRCHSVLPAASLAKRREIICKSGA